MVKKKVPKLTPPQGGLPNNTLVGSSNDTDGVIEEVPSSLTEDLEADNSGTFEESLDDFAADLEDLGEDPDIPEDSIEVPAEVQVFYDSDVEINPGNDDPMELPEDALIGHDDPTREYQGLDPDTEASVDELLGGSSIADTIMNEDSGEFEPVDDEFLDGGDSLDTSIHKEPTDLDENWEKAKRDGIADKNSIGHYVGKGLVYLAALTVGLGLGTAIFAPDKIIELKQKYSSDKPTAVVQSENVPIGTRTVGEFLDRQYGPRGKDRLERPLEDILAGVTATPAFDAPQPDPYDIDPNPKDPLTNYVGTLDSAPQGSSLTQIAAAILGEGQLGINFLELSQTEQKTLLDEVYVSNVTSKYTPEQVKNVLSLAMVLQDQNPHAVRNPINTEKLSSYQELIELARDPNNARLLKGSALNATVSLEAVEDGPIFTGTPVVEHFPPQEEPEEYSIQPEVTNSLEMVLEEPHQQATTEPRIQQPVEDPKEAWKQEAEEYIFGKDDVDLGEPIGYEQPVEELELDTDEIPDVTAEMKEEALDEFLADWDEIAAVASEDLVDTGLTVVQDDGIVDTGLQAVLNPSGNTRAGAIIDSISPSTMPREEVATYTQSFLDVYRLSQSSMADWKGDTTALAMQAAQSYTQNPESFDSPKERRLLRNMQEFYDFDESDRLEAAIGHYFTQQEQSEMFEGQDLDLDVRGISTIYSVQQSKLKKSIRNVERVDEHSLRYEVGENISSILASTDHSRNQLYSDLRLAGINAVADRTVSMYEGYQEALEENPELTKIAYAREHAETYGVTAETLAGNMTEMSYVVAQESVEASGKSSSTSSAKKSA